jgi:hypothetical protein
VPFSEIGLRVLHQLVKRGIKIITCLMAMGQTYLAALSGYYVSLFSARAGHGLRRPPILKLAPPKTRKRECRRIRTGTATDGCQRGARGRGASDGDVILRKDGVEPRTIETINEFNAAWRSRPTKR